MRLHGRINRMDVFSTHVITSVDLLFEANARRITRVLIPTQTETKGELL